MRSIKSLACAFLATAALAGCRIDQAESIDLTLEGTPKHFVAGFGQETRTSVDADGKTSWNAGDIVRYYSAAAGTVGTVTVESDCDRFEFTANVGNDDSFFIAEYGGTDIADNNDGLSFTISNAVMEEQSGRFEDAQLAVAKVYVEPGSEPQTLSFRNVTSLIEFTIDRPDVSKVVFNAIGGEALHGNGGIDITFNETEASAAFAGDCGSSVTVNTDGAGTFYIATLPVTLANGFSIECFASDGTSMGSVIGHNPLVLNQNSIVSLGTVDVLCDNCVDLSAECTSNCYVVSGPGDYKFYAMVKGNSTEALDGIPYSADVLWESFGNAERPAIGDIVSNVTFRNGYVCFTSGLEGNAVIAVRDGSGEILWSWHVWSTQKPKNHTYYNGVGFVMDRNLGATTKETGEVGSLGLIYQWGRKDPFLGGCPTSSTTPAESTIEWPDAEESNVVKGTMEYAVKHPTTFITYGTSANNDWIHSKYSTPDRNRWNSNKGMYDPCPPGYRVPDGIWAVALGSGSTVNGSWNKSKRGMDFGSSRNYRFGYDDSIWYPAAGYRHSLDGKLRQVGSNGMYWSCTFEGAFVNDLNFSNGNVNPLDYTAPAVGLSVRCVSDKGPAIVPVTSVNISRTSLDLNLGETATLTATAVPSDASLKDELVWSSSNYSVVNVNYNSGVITAKSTGTATITVTSYNGKTATCTVNVTRNSVNLSANGTANCYLVSRAGDYSFNAVKGNSNESVGDVKGVKVLWESFGTDVAPAVGDIINPEVSYKNGIISFSTNNTFRTGNAVIAAFSDAACSEGKVLWSWHIWCAEKPEDIRYKNGAGFMMDRNLGATSIEPNTVGSLGLLYQWGRKDPFLGSSNTGSDEKAKSTASWPSCVYSDSSNGTIEYAVSHPMTFITYNFSNHDWYYTGSSKTDNTRWTESTSAKSIYDPCPSGYRVPDGGTDTSRSVWVKAFSSNYYFSFPNFDATSHGMNFGKTNGLAINRQLGDYDVIWYPMAGFVDYNSGQVSATGKCGVYWSATPNSSSSTVYDFYLDSSYGEAYPNYTADRSYGQSVRCYKEQ